MAGLDDAAIEPIARAMIEILPRDRMVLWNRAGEPFLMHYRVEHTRWCLIYWPTEQEAAIEGLSYREYVDLFLNACNQPWREIHAAQGRLVEMLADPTTLEIEAGT